MPPPGPRTARRTTPKRRSWSPRRGPGRVLPLSAAWWPRSAAGRPAARCV